MTIKQLVPPLHVDLPAWLNGDVLLYVFLFALFGLLCTFLIQRRNDRVLQFRTELINAVRRAAETDASLGKEYDWRYEALLEAMHAVTYEQMLYKFWRRLDSFYPDRSFTEEQCER